MHNEDLLFWTGILADHAKFQINAFSPKEVLLIKEAEKFHLYFAEKNEALKQKENVDINDLEKHTSDFIDFKKSMITSLLHHNILINFSPSFINHMVNEADEFLSMLRGSVLPGKMENPPLYMKTWLADASGHASTLAAFLDFAEVPTIKQGQIFKQMFDDLGKKASEVTNIKENLHTDIDVGLLKNEVIYTLDEFIKYCEGVGELLDEKKIMSIGTLSSEVTNHFIKEHNYFIQKLEAIG